MPSGADTVIAIFEEDTYNQDPSTPDGQLVYVVNFNLAVQQNLVQSNVRGAGRQRRKPGQGNRTVTGAIETEINAQSQGILLKHLMGGESHSGGPQYTHVYTPDALPVGMTFEKDYGPDISGVGRYEKFNGCRFDNAVFNFPQEGACTVQWNVIGANMVQSDTPLDATLTDNLATSFFSVDAVMTENGSAFAIAQNIRLQIGNSLAQGVYTINPTGQRRSLPSGFCTVTGTLDAIFESPDLITRALNGTPSSLEIELIFGDGLGSAGNEYTKYDVQQLLYSPTSAVTQGEGEYTLSLNFGGYLEGASDSIEITTRNEVATV